MIFKKEPVDFKTKMDVVACYVQHKGKFLLLKRQPHKSHGGKWGLPAGKVGVGESYESAVVREVSEETGIEIKKEDFKQLQTLWVRIEGLDFQYHTFAVELASLLEITLSDEEHQEYVWVSPEESLQVDTIHDLRECTKLFFSL
ncbi:MAG: NUDIX hydrolase [Candidatus Pacebacteria bacterium]|nr:NUDIX hydrolase [Candidatus Paceibacterota bacterium]MCF7857359.1 NUDIX hydrolase [Candidatus Paceibacterota bacterium]